MIIFPTKTEALLAKELKVGQEATQGRKCVDMGSDEKDMPKIRGA